MNVQYQKAQRIAMVAYAVLLAFTLVNDGVNLPPWRELDESEQNKRTAVVQDLQDNAGLDVETYQELVVERLVADGWVYGKTLRNEAAQVEDGVTLAPAVKTHPMCRPFYECTKSDRIRLALTVATIRALLTEG